MSSIPSDPSNFCQSLWCFRCSNKFMFASSSRVYKIFNSWDFYKKKITWKNYTILNIFYFSTTTWKKIYFYIKITNFNSSFDLQNGVILVRFFQRRILFLKTYTYVFNIAEYPVIILTRWLPSVLRSNSFTVSFLIVFSQRVNGLLGLLNSNNVVHESQKTI